MKMAAVAAAANQHGGWGELPGDAGAGQARGGLLREEGRGGGEDPGLRGN